MGSRNANRRGRVDRPEAAEVNKPILVECVTPEGLRARAEIMRKQGDESCARHLELAAAEIEKLRKPKRLDDDSVCAHSFGTAVNTDCKEMRLAFYAKAKQKDLLGYMLFDPPEAYEFAHVILKEYDELEGIK